VFLGHPGTKEVLKRHIAKDCNVHCKKRQIGMQSKLQDHAPECKRNANEQEKEKPVAGSADRGPAGDQAGEDWLARMSPALRARFQGALDEMSEDS
jgi:hypothetical protein